MRAGDDDEYDVRSDRRMTMMNGRHDDDWISVNMTVSRRNL